MNIEKNLNIAKTMRETYARRKTQNCRTFKFKVDKSRLTSQQKEQLKMMLVESKWIYNYIVGNCDPYNVSDKDLVNITHKDKDNNDINVKITHVGSSVKQQIIKQIQDQIKCLSVLKKKGNNVGSLKFKSEYKAIKFKQYGTTHKIKDNNHIKLQNIKKPIKVHGLKQIKDLNLELTTCILYFDGYDYWIYLSCYENKKDLNINENNIIGVDLGVKDTVTLSDGTKIDVSVKETERMKKLQRKLAIQKRRSNNWYKTKSLICKEWTHICNIKNDKANKIVASICNGHNLIITQNDNISEWKEEYHKDKNRKIQHSILGRLKSKMNERENVIFLDRWFPTTKLCTKCGHKTEISTDERTFICANCGHTDDRDIHAANNMIWLYRWNKDNADKAGTVYTDKKLVTSKLFYKNYRTICWDQEATTSSALL